MMSYQEERDRFIARMATEGLDIDTTRRLLRAATTLQRYAELACSSEAADRDRVPCPGIKDRKACICDDYPAGEHAAGRHTQVTRIARDGDRLSRRLEAAMPKGWTLDEQGDPRGYVLRVIPPSYAEHNQGRNRFDPRAIGVPSGPTRLRF